MLYKGTKEMNANELAEDLEGAKLVILKLNEMLRQQQAEIEALKAAKIRAYDNGVEDGRKPNTNNKPVAWMHQNPDYAISKHQSLEYNIPLYTHPVKELTDEEITAIAKEIFKDYKNFHHYQIDFARAVIKEVSGK